MKKIKIEKDVPLPPKRNTHKFPLSQMEVGDSFWTEIRTVQQAAQYFSAKHNRKFTCRKDGVGMRVWRTE